MNRNTHYVVEQNFNSNDTAVRMEYNTLHYLLGLNNRTPNQEIILVQALQRGDIAKK